LLLPRNHRFVMEEPLSETSGNGSSPDGGTDQPPRITERRLQAVPSSGPVASPSNTPSHGGVVTFNKNELREILNLYGRMVAAGEWRDYAIDFNTSRAVFSIFRRSSEMPLYRIEKDPKLARKQGVYSVVAATGLILKRGHELARVISVLDKRVKLVVS
jgi:hypothetical protein